MRHSAAVKCWWDESAPAGPGAYGIALAAPGPVTLDDVQAQMLEAILGEWKTVKSTLLHSATGSGKTVLAAKLVRRLRIDDRSSKVLFVVDSEQLVIQTRDKFTKWGVRTVVEREKSRAKESDVLWRLADAAVATRQSLYERRLKAGFGATDFSHVIIDEAHVGLKGKQLQAILEHFPAAKVLMLSATPWLAGGKPLVPAHCETLAFHYPLDDYPDGKPGAISNGHLVPPFPIEGRATVNLRDIKVGQTTHGQDYNVSALEARVSKAMGELTNAAFEQMKEHGVNRAICFCPNVASARLAADAFVALGLNSEAVYGEHPDPGSVFARYHRGEIRVLCVCDMASKGFDDPPTDCLVMMRPTKSKSLFFQQIGRGLRLSPGKTRCLVIGFRWECDKEGPVSTLDLFAAGMTEKAKQVFAGLMRASKGPVDVQKVAKQARELAEREEERERVQKAAALRARVQRQESGVKFRTIEPFPGRNRKERRALEVLAAARNGELRVTQDIAERLVNAGYDGRLDLSHAEAVGWLIQWDGRREAGMASFPQCQFLQRLGVAMRQAFEFTAREASELIGRLRAGGSA